MEKLDMRTKNNIENNIDKLKELFPHVVTETRDKEGILIKSIDFDMLKQELSDQLADGIKERYQMTWPGKKEALLTANTPINKTLRPVREDSVNWDNTENLYIEGDNLEALKLLQESYLGKVKMIYIDPPYNTGSDFVYKDKFSKSKKDHQLDMEDINEEGEKLSDRYQINNEYNGRYHSDWLTMMYPRLKLARNLLKDDGVIFISIDENEIDNLKKLCNEIFGEINYISIISVINNLKSRSDDKFFATCNEFLLVYAKNINQLEINGFEIEEEELEDQYSDKDEIGYFKPIGFRKTGTGWQRKNRPFMFYPVLYKDHNFTSVSDNEFDKIYDKKEKQFNDTYLEKLINKYMKLGYKVYLPTNTDGEYGRWRWGREKFFKEKDYNLTFNSANSVCTKMRANIEDGSLRVKTAKTLWYKPEYDTGSGSKILKKLFNNSGDIFSNPKSLIYIKDILKISTGMNDLVLDFFSGSATTAHALMKLNSEDGKKRKYIMVQLHEPTEKNTESYNAGYKSICEIGKERIRRAGKQIYKDSKKQEGQLSVDEVDEDERKSDNLDIGFRVYKIDSSNMKDIYYNPNKIEQGKLDDMISNVKEDRTDEDLLTQVILDMGLELSLPMETKTIDNKQVYFVGYNSLIACFEDHISKEVVKEIAETKPLKVVFKDTSFEKDDQRINLEETFKQISPDTIIKVI